MLPTTTGGHFHSGTRETLIPFNARPSSTMQCCDTCQDDSLRIGRVLFSIFAILLIALGIIGIVIRLRGGGFLYMLNFSIILCFIGVLLLVLCSFTEE